MKKLESLGKTIARDQQKKIFGGNSVEDPGGDLPCLGKGTCSATLDNCCPGYMCCNYMGVYGCVAKSSMC